MVPTCPNCGADVSRAPPGVGRRCEFCGAELPVAPIPITPFGGGPPAFVPPPPTPTSPIFVVVPILLVLVLVFGGGALAFVQERRAKRQAEEEQARAMQQANEAAAQAMREADLAQSLAASAETAAGMHPTAPTGPKVYGLDELRTSEFRGMQPIDAPGMVGTLDAFDPGANATWANDVARHWAADARLVLVEVDHVSRTGLVHAKTSMGAKVTYRFVSPVQAAKWRAAKGAVAPDVETELALEVSKDGVRAQKSTTEPLGAAPPAVTVPCGLAGALAKQPLRGFYDVTLSGSGWSGTDGKALACP